MAGSKEVQKIRKPRRGNWSYQCSCITPMLFCSRGYQYSVSEDNENFARQIPDAPKAIGIALSTADRITSEIHLDIYRILITAFFGLVMSGIVGRILLLISSQVIITLTGLYLLRRRIKRLILNSQKAEKNLPDARRQITLEKKDRGTRSEISKRHDGAIVLRRSKMQIREEDIHARPL